MAIMKVKKLGIQKKRGHSYFLDKDGDISSVIMSSGKVQKVQEVGIERQPGHYYLLDQQGDLVCAKMARGAGAKKK